jgi:hypothetical protein
MVNQQANYAPVENSVSARADCALGEVLERFIEEEGPSVALADRFGGQKRMLECRKAYHAAEAGKAVQFARRVLDAAIELAHSPHKSTPILGYVRQAVALGRSDDGRLVVQRGSLVDTFLQKMEGAELKRIGRCTVCGCYFYAQRLVDNHAPDGCKEHGQSVRTQRYRKRKT